MCVKGNMYYKCMDYMDNPNTCTMHYICITHVIHMWHILLCDVYIIAQLTIYKLLKYFWMSPNANSLQLVSHVRNVILLSLS